MNRKPMNSPSNVGIVLLCNMAALVLLALAFLLEGYHHG